MTAARPSVVAIGIDAADPDLVDRWMAEGALPNLRRLRERGAFARLANFDFPKAEITWTTFLTGCSPERTGFWSQYRFDPASYGIASDKHRSYDFEEIPPFYAAGPGFRVAALDIPQTRLSPRVDGVQVLGWGAHSSYSPSHSEPAGLLAELTERHGPHPALNKDHGDTRDVAALERLARDLETGIARRAAIAIDLLSRERWSLLLTAFCETHAAGHIFWHLGRSSHPLHAAIAATARDALKSVYMATDRALGEIVARAPADATVVVFSLNGMGPSAVEFPSLVFLPEALFRLSFPGRAALARGRPGTPVGAPILDGLAPQDSLWRLVEDGSRARRFLRRALPARLFKPWRFPSADLFGTFDLAAMNAPFASCPAHWYRKSWPRMRAFALPSYSEGLVRVNLAGREAGGVVPPAEFDAVAREVEALVLGLRDTRTGRPIAKEVRRARTRPDDRDPRRPDADLVVLWNDEPATDTIEGAAIGRIGPVPYFRTGGHHPEGFVCAAGPGIGAGSALAGVHAIDLAPTLLALMGAPVPEVLEGKRLFERVAARAA